MRKELEKEIGIVTNEEYKTALEMTYLDLEGNMKESATESEFLNIMSICVSVLRRCR